jgi:hypothetical protein
MSLHARGDELRKIVYSLLFLSALSLGSVAPAQAGPSYFDFKTGFGDEIVINKGWLGTKHTLVKDRIGDKYENKKGLLGNKEFSAGILGNSVTKKRSILGRKEYKVQSMLGDSISYKKGWFVRRADVDATGISSLIGQGIHTLKGSMLSPQQIPGMGGFDPNMQAPGVQPGFDPQGQALDPSAAQSLDANQALPDANQGIGSQFPNSNP